jgi:hypothetical protein
MVAKDQSLCFDGIIHFFRVGGPIHTRGRKAVIYQLYLHPVLICELQICLLATESQCLHANVRLVFGLLSRVFQSCIKVFDFLAWQFADLGQFLNRESSRCKVSAFNEVNNRTFGGPLGTQIFAEG